MLQVLTIEGKILIFKTLAISKVVYLVLVKAVPSGTIAQFKKNTTIYFEKRKS